MVIVGLLSVGPRAQHASKLATSPNQVPGALVLSFWPVSELAVATQPRALCLSTPLESDRHWTRLVQSGGGQPIGLGADGSHLPAWTLSTASLTMS